MSHNRTPNAKSKRGGRRPGAGAPLGNLNGLKHGRRSRQLAQLGALILADPVLSVPIANLGKRLGPQQQNNRKTIAILLGRLVKHNLNLSPASEAELSGLFQNIRDIVDRP